MRKKLSVPIYVTAFAISLIIFILGIYVGMALDATFTESLTSDVGRISSRLSSTELFLLLGEESKSFCPLYSSELESINNDVEELGHKLSYLEDEKNVFDDELKRDYFVLEAQSYLMSKRMKGLCDDETVLLLYFYSNRDCETCGEQGIEILRFRDSAAADGTAVKIYSFDGELGSAIVDVFRDQFSVEIYPTMVIDGKKIEGYHSAEEIGESLEAVE